MPSSLIVVALFVAWLAVLVPMIARRRQEVARPTDSALAARVVRSGSAHARLEDTMSDAEPEPDREDVPREPDTDHAVIEDEYEDYDDEGYEDESYVDESYVDEPRYSRPYRPGRGGFDPEAAAVIARAKYSYRQRVVLAMIVLAIGTAIAAATAFPLVWWPHALIDTALVGYLTYLRRQVRIEQEIRERRLARIRHARQSAPARPHTASAHGLAPRPKLPSTPLRPGTAVVELDDEDPAFDDLDDPRALPYRRAAGE
jgi:hypothetical protein